VDDRVGEDRPSLLDWRQVLRSHLASAEHAEGLRERKKRLMRQQISDTATLMFLERGFDEVRITEIAAACGVSEKTIYNYFPTKESLVLDREDWMADEIRRVLGPTAAKVSPVDAIVEIIRGQLAEMIGYSESAGLSDMTMIRGFADLVQQTPSLRAAQIDSAERLAQIAATAMAERAGMDPDDPEPQIAATSLLGLWQIFFKAGIKYADESTTPAEFEKAVTNEVERAARLVDSGLWSFAMAVQGANGRDQLKIAAEASNEARKQVVVAIKQAKDAWRQMKIEMKTTAHEERDHLRESRSSLEQQARDLTKQAREASQEIRRESQKMRQAAQQQSRDAQKARSDARRRGKTDPFAD
jgi:AcrR family transcriptional regulator